MTSDYEGLEAQFAAGLQSGQATLDSVRLALREAPKVGLQTNAKYAMWGYSGGALACGWAAELQPTYAPELEFAGAAFGGLLPNLSSAIQATNGGPLASAAFGIVTGISKAYPNASEWLDTGLIPELKSKFYAPSNACLLGQVFDGVLGSLYNWFISGREAFAHSVPSSVFGPANQMGLRGTPRMPLLIYKAELDEISPTKDTDELVHKYCSEGSTIEYHHILLAEHVTAALAGAVNALEWLSDRLGGKSVENTDSCVTKDLLLSDIDMESLPFVTSSLVAGLTSVLGGKLGQGVL